MGKERISRFWRQCFVTAAVGSNIIGHGCVIGYPAILLPQLLAPDSEIPMTKTAASWFASVIGVTQLLGSFITPPIMERFGRRIAHLAVTMPVLIGWFITMMATSYKPLLIGSILQGLSIGMLLPLRSILIGESASPKNRGAFLTTVSLTQAFGILFVHVLGSVVTWQKTALICVFFSFFSLVMTLYSPESPSWLASRGKYKECREVFHWLRGEEEDNELEEMIHARLMFEKAKHEQKLDRKVSRMKTTMATIQKPEFYKPILIMIHAYVMVQFAGGTTMAAYSTTIISLIMGPDVNAHFWMIFLDTQRFISNTVAVVLINKIKRRTMMFLTGGLCVISHLAIASYTYMKKEGLLTYDAVWIPALLINLQFFTVATGMLPLPSVIDGEVFPLEYRSIGGSISLATMSASMFLVLKTFLGLVESVGIYGTYSIYAGLLTYCLLVILLLLPETRGKTLQQIEDEIRGRPLGASGLPLNSSSISSGDRGANDVPVLSRPELQEEISARRLSTPLLH